MVFLVGFALFGAIAFIPLFVQTVQGGTATQAGQVLTPLFLGWVVMSIVGARATVMLGYRTRRHRRQRDDDPRVLRPDAGDGDVAGRGSC